LRYHIYYDHDDIHLQIDSSYNVVIIEGRDELNRLMLKLKEALEKDNAIPIREKRR